MRFWFTKKSRPEWEWWQRPMLVTPEGWWLLDRKQYDGWMQKALPYGWYIVGQPPAPPDDSVGRADGSGLPAQSAGSVADDRADLTDGQVRS